eukprot:TRINITY_DN6482_c0_g7_i1.p1 TRINITY_DN6482_c0_g7~~TRINITY_DN6482_c0_g7_i1.p1  ORF type:complete len:355 (+),score=97.16 TRINITY_DN6482_c0_g7_i1:123-1067(+)
MVCQRAGSNAYWLAAENIVNKMRKQPDSSELGQSFVVDTLKAYPGVSMHKLSFDEEKRVTTYCGRDGTSKLILKTMVCPLNAERYIKSFKDEYDLIAKMDKLRQSNITPLNRREYRDEPKQEIQIAALFEMREKVDAQRLLELAISSLKVLADLSNNSEVRFDLTPDNALFQNNIARINIVKQANASPMKIIIPSAVTREERIYVLEYCPPEVHRKVGRYFFNSIDVYSWGMTIYQLASGKFLGELIEENENYKTCDKNYKDFLKLIKGITMANDGVGVITRGVVKVLLKALSEDPKERPSFRELLRELGKSGK